MDIDRLKQAVSRFYMIILITIALCVGGAFILNAAVKPVYEATSSVVVSISSTGDAGIYNEFLASQLLAGTYKDILSSHYLAEKAKEKLGTSLTAAKLQKKLTVETNADTLVIKLKVRDSNVKDAVAIANAFSETFLSEAKSIIQYTNLSILDLANIEQASDPVSPKKAFNLAVSLFIGVFAGLSAALGLEFRREQRKRKIYQERELSES
ncbi:YveK family protein [Paenibacillus sp. NPDC058071]|uniref:YveK family protein n=1 Tax=Paenibacillus sp. NPDC058071 TaxID=3346326 RepID=UPI0036DDB9E4